MNHPCEVWGVHRSWWGRMKDRLTRGHACHVCERSRPFMQEHEGRHACSCGLRYDKTATDNAATEAE